MRTNQSALKRGSVLSILVALVLLACLSSGWSLPADSPNATGGPNARETDLAQPTSAELRGVWITNVASSVLFAPWGISRAVHQLADMHFNTVYPVVWNRGKTFYHSSALKQITGQAMDPLLALTHPLADPLEEMVRVGHRQKLRVIPWFEYGFMVPLHAELVRQHPDWLTCRQNGSWLLTADALHANEASLLEDPPLEDSPSGLSRLLNSGAPHQLAWLNPLHPSVQGLLLGLVEEVVSKYAVDGIQFDDHFSLPVEFGYDDYTVSLYQAEHAGQKPPANPADEDWIRWRADKLSKFVNVLHAQVKAHCPTCILSLSPNPAKFAYRFYLQDWGYWAEQGWLDELVIQVYRDQLAQFESELNKARLQAVRDRIPVSVGILTGTWRHPIAFEQIRDQVEISRDRHFAGVSFFYWETLWSYFTPESPRQRRQNFRRLLPAFSANLSRL